MAARKWINDTGTTTYNSWRSMRNRVLYDSCENHKFYKEKGIQICQRWIDSFDRFVEDIVIDGNWVWMLNGVLAVLMMFVHAVMCDEALRGDSG